MNADLVKDREANFAVLNYVRAAYQGKLAGINLLAQVMFPGFTPEAIAPVQQSLNKANALVEQLFAGECLFSASSPSLDTFDAQTAIDMLGRMVPDIAAAADECARIMSLQVQPSGDEIKLILSALFRSLYSRDTYIRGFVDFCKKFGSPDRLKGYEQLLQDSTRDISGAQEILRLFRESGFHTQDMNPNFLPRLHQACALLPITFRTHVHDINQLLAPFRGGTSFGTLGFPPAEEEEWKASGFGPVAAGYWRAHFFRADEAKAWNDAGFTLPSLAISWRSFGFDPVAGAPWAREGFPPGYALQWINAGYDIERAKKAIEGGMKMPPPRT